MKFLKLLAIGAAILLSGCAITKDGVLFPGGTAPNKADVSDFMKRNDISNPAAAPEKTGEQAVVTAVEKQAIKSGAKKIVVDSVNEIRGKAKLIIVGTVMSRNELTPKQLDERYDVYEKNMLAAKRPLAMSRQWYTSTIGGVVNLKVGGITGVYTRMYPVEMDKEMMGKINFPSTFNTLMFGASSDLVAAEDDGERVLQITRILCSEKSSDFSECSGKFAKGIFQGKDGLEIDTNLKIKEDGAKIDTATYQKM